ncbi:unnamed protein product, partial [Mesorhabditis spiculigera]
MEGLETGPLTADPLLSQALSSLPSNRLHDHHPSLPSPSDDFSDLLHPGLDHSYNQFATLQPLAPLPPISTVTGQCRPAPSPPRQPPVSNTQSAFYFPPTTAQSFPFNNINIKYEYEVKSDSAEHSPHETNGVTLPQDFSPHGIQDPMFSSGVFSHTSYNSPMEQRQPRSPKLEKPYFDNYVGDETPELKSLSPDLGGDCGDGDELDTKELATRISAELKRYSIPQAIFAQRVLCRSQGTLSDLLRNPKPWPKLKSGRETFRRMAKWLQEPEHQRMGALRFAASTIAGTKRRDDTPGNGPKKPRLVFTDIQRRTLQAIFKETKRPSREMQHTISQQLNLDPNTVSNFFMNARRRGHDREDESGDGASIASSTDHTQCIDDEQRYQSAPPDPTNASICSYVQTEEIHKLIDTQDLDLGDSIIVSKSQHHQNLEDQEEDEEPHFKVIKREVGKGGQPRVIDVLKSQMPIYAVRPNGHQNNAIITGSHVIQPNPVFEQL